MMYAKMRISQLVTHQYWEVVLQLYNAKSFSAATEQARIFMATVSLMNPELTSRLEVISVDRLSGGVTLAFATNEDKADVNILVPVGDPEEMKGLIGAFKLFMGLNNVGTTKEA